MKKLLYFVLKLVPAGIMLQTLFYKFTAAEESVYIFTKLGAEPFGRVGVGILELVASVLILNPKTTFYGAGMGLGLMMGAIASHLLVLGINVDNDGGLLFILALVTAVFCAVLLVLNRQQWTVLLKRITN